MKRTSTANRARGDQELELADSRGASASASKSETISFRLGGECLACLQGRAALQELSLHQYAKHAVIEALMQNVSERPGDPWVEGLAKETTRLRSDLAFAMKTLLMTAGNMPEKDAEAWTKKNFKV